MSLLLLTTALACSCSRPAPSRQDAVEDGGAATAATAAGAPADIGPEAGPTELRGVWLTRFEWSDGSATDLQQTLAEIADAGFNTVFFQVRGNFDAYYDSRLEPWAAALSGSLGTDPGWDPLQVAVDEAHRHGLQLHAYINVAPLWRGPAPVPGEFHYPFKKGNGIRLAPWRVADEDGVPMPFNDGYVFASLGNPDVRAWTAAVAADIAGRYDVDGIHLDYIRYPGPGYSHDPVSEARFVQDTAAGGALAGLSWSDWQRAMVQDTVRQVRDAVDVPVTAAVWGIHSDVWGWGGVSEGYADYYQDSRAFLSKGLTDANIPMAYWPVAAVEGDRLDFRAIARDHVAHAAGRHVYMGIGSYDIGYDQTLRCIEAAREEGAQGVVLFSWSSVADHAADLRGGPFATPARPPPMTWR